MRKGLFNSVEMLLINVPKCGAREENREAVLSGPIYIIKYTRKGNTLTYKLEEREKTVKISSQIMNGVKWLKIVTKLPFQL